MLISYLDINLDFRKNENNEILVSGTTYDRIFTNESIKEIRLLVCYDAAKDEDSFVYCYIYFNSSRSVGLNYLEIPEDVLELFRENITNFMKLEISVLMERKIFPDRLENLLNRLSDDDRLEISINNL